MMKNKLVIFLLLAQVSFLFSCQKREETTRAFYFWKSSWKTDVYARQMLDSLHSSLIYLRIFDVVWSPHANNVTPAAKLEVKDSLSKYCRYIPVIYITNEALLKTTLDNIPTLAQRMHDLRSLITKELKLSYTEIQYDCDWSDDTKEKYFLLLKELKKLKPETKISATIRLHQIKYYQRTGIPPADRGMLMFYNMGRVGDVRSVNSIYNKKDAEKYTKYICDYPLNCDVALPIFRWAVLFQKGKISALLNNVTAKELTEAGFIKNTSGYYSPPKAMYFKGYYVEPGDAIRAEEITPELALEAARLLAEQMPSYNLTVSLYHLEPEYLKSYGKENLERIYTAFE